MSLVTECQTDLHYCARSLAELEQHRPHSTLDRWLYLNSRRNLLGQLADAAANLADAHEEADDLPAARGTTELAEHYLYLHSVADGRVEEFRPVVVRAIDSALGTRR
ncbi:hypothetical protein [Streptomyces lunalinharesii]|uniref:Uncharacterized protein n=1 Tax=Streptomyces lunalinharesii TaxID=333384 RepID=A0ABN3SVJ4_9ACTN